jgi:hypothetical protein
MPLLAVLLCAAAAPDAAQEARLLETKDCVEQPTSSIGDDFETVCGFNGLAMSESGDRLLSITVAGRVQLWSREGEELAALETASIGSEQLMVAGGRAIFLDGRGSLVLLDARTGAETARFANMPSWGQLHRMVEADLLYLTTFPPGGYSERESLLVSLADGSVRVRRMTGPMPRYVSGRWAAGVTTHKDDKGVWRARLHLADAALTQVPLERWCEPIGPLRFCYRSHWDGPNIELFDVESRSWSRRDMGVPLISTTMVDWAQAGGRIFPVVCALQASPKAKARYACRIIDLADGRIVHRFQAESNIVAGGVNPDGQPELRLAIQGPDTNLIWSLFRIGLDGNVRSLGTFNQHRPFALDGPAGLLWTSTRDQPEMMVAENSSGEPVARMDGRFHRCARMHTTWHSQSCQVSSDRRTIAGFAGDGRIVWGPIIWSEGFAPIREMPDR